MNLYRISQTVNNNYGTYHSAIVLADTAEEAQQTHPNDVYTWDKERKTWFFVSPYGPHRGERFDEKSTGDWTNILDVKVELLGAADPRFVDMNIGQSRVICADYAGE